MFKLNNFSKPRPSIILGREDHTGAGTLFNCGGHKIEATLKKNTYLPLKAFKKFPDSMPYIGAFTTHTEQLLVPYVAKIKESLKASS